MENEPDSAADPRSLEPAPPSMPEEHSEQEASVALGSGVPRFCGRCGTALGLSQPECPVCAIRSRLGLPGEPLRLDRRNPVVSALGLYFALLLISLGAMVSPADHAATILVADVVSTLVVAVWALVSWRTIRSGLAVRGAASAYAWAPVFALFTFVTASAAVGLLVHVSGIEEIRLTRPFLTAGYGWGIILLSSCAQPAIVEEIAFRGIILSVCQRILSTREAVVVTALLFMVLHLTIGSFPHLLLIGLVLGYLRVTSGSLYPCILMHGLHNLLCVGYEAFGG